ncbi:MAG TPA: glycine--tRNA ligase subunit beta, partial [Rudaea sp.]|nr:glycine--tRNA ligase subunit beta [Rudaea sp.]
MSDLKPLLVEIGTEELPPRALDDLAAAFAKGICEGLAKRDIGADVANARSYNSPRRLALLVPGVATMQPAQKSEVLGPYLNVGLGADGKPTPALLGFAGKNGVGIEQLQRTRD